MNVNDGKCYGDVEDLIKDVWQGDVLVTDKSVAEAYADDERLVSEGIMAFDQGGRGFFFQGQTPTQSKWRLQGTSTLCLPLLMR